MNGFDHLQKMREQQEMQKVKNEKLGSKLSGLYKLEWEQLYYL